MFDPKLTVDDERKRKIDRIRGYAEKFEQVSKDYNRLLHMVEEEKFLLRHDRASEAFLAFVEAAGAIVSDSLCQSATLLEMLESAGKKDIREPRNWIS